MSKVVLVLAAISAFLYLVFSCAGWYRQASKSGKGSDSPPKAYIWGLSFAVLYYYGFPLWWWRYGFLRTMQLLITCIVTGVVVQSVLRLIGAIEIDNFNESLFVGLLIAVPIRAIAGIWVAVKDGEWRRAIFLKRNSRLSRLHPG